MSDSPAPLVSLRGVTRAFGDVVALADVDLDVVAGSITVLLGPNGAGKTTCTRIVTGALVPDQGTVRTLGADPAGPDGEEVRRRCGVVPARPGLYDRLSGRENLRFAAELFGVDDPEGRADRAAARFRIDDALDRKVGGYSTGMRARLALARAVIHDPDLLLLDEPTAGLDPESAKEVLGLIHELASRGAGVVMCTHLLLEAEGLADQVVVMDHGQVLVAGAADELARSLWARPRVLVEVEHPAMLDVVTGVAGVASAERTAPDQAVLDLHDGTSVPDLVAGLVAEGVRLRRVDPQVPTLEELYFAVRQGRMP